ncbi:MAG: hypothetical protein ACO1TE_15330 [Prosthecobacter sp.]
MNSAPRQTAPEETLPPYRRATTSLGHGVVELLFGGAMIAICLFLLRMIWSDQSTSNEMVLPTLMVGPICAGMACFMVQAVCNILRPQEGWIQVDGEAISWHDWLGPVSLRGKRYPLLQIQCIKQGNESSDYLLLQDGTHVELPCLVIPDMDEFRRELKARAPHIVAKAWDGTIME